MEVMEGLNVTRISHGELEVKMYYSVWAQRSRHARGKQEQINIYSNKILPNYVYLLVSSEC